MADTQLTLQPGNINQFQPTKFLITIARFPNMNWWAQKVSFPGVSSGPSTQLTPFANIPRTGSKVIFEPLTINFILDEDLWAWTELANWIIAAGDGKNFTGRQGLVTQNGNNSDITSDLIITTFTNKNNPNLQFKYHDAFPSAVPGFEGDSSADAETTLTSSVTFQYKIFEITRLKLPPTE